jgi:hypothetical protein
LQPMIRPNLHLSEGEEHAVKDLVGTFVVARSGCRRGTSGTAVFL